LEYLEIEPFCFARSLSLHYRRSCITRKSTLIVCSCNVLSDDDVRSAVSASAGLPRTARQLYGCLGCSAECGRCARTINKIIKDALGACAKECADGCPHAARHSEAHVVSNQAGHVFPA
jgi:bacterioferritin-associated ferredoxin